MIKQIYDYLRGEKMKPEWRMYKNAAMPKANFTLWIMLNRKLATVDRLAKWGITLDKTCVLCKNVDKVWIICSYSVTMQGKYGKEY